MSFELVLQLAILAWKQAKGRLVGVDSVGAGGREVSWVMARGALMADDESVSIVGSDGFRLLRQVLSSSPEQQSQCLMRAPGN